jgi:AcrR family transcriptional regulator
MADVYSPAANRPPRRLPREARRGQLVTAAMPIVARQGLAEFSLDAVAARADVTRNLLYHYFPRGRPDIAAAVVERAGRQLTEGWVLDEALPLPERLGANFSRIMDHALAPTHAWRIHRLARAAPDPALAAITERFVDIVVSSVSLNHLGTAEPPPLVGLALQGFVALTETVLDQARAHRLPRAEVGALLARILTASVSAGMESAAGSPG